MKGLLVLALSALPLVSFANIVDLQKQPVHQVLDVYEQQREEEETDHKWIHAFEEESLGNEMDHMAKLRSGIQEQEAME